MVFFILINIFLITIISNPNSGRGNQICPVKNRQMLGFSSCLAQWYSVLRCTRIYPLKLTILLKHRFRILRFMNLR